MRALLHEALISLLEKIVLHNNQFSGIKQFQNLLIITAINNDKGKVMDYVNRLDGFDGPKVAQIARENKLYEEAVVVFKKIGENVEAIQTLITFIESLDRAAEFAERCNTPDVWSVLGKAYLDRYLINEAVDCFIKADNPTHFMDVIEASENEEKWDILIQYLMMAKKTMKDTQVDSELLFCYAKTENMSELEAFLASPSSADIQQVGDRCFQQRLFESAKVMYTKLKSNARIASCLVYLKQYPQALEAAKKAKNTKTWKEIALACLRAGEYKLASVAGSNIVIHPDHLEELVKLYEKFDVAEEMITLLEGCLTMEKTHIGLFTELGMLYAKYKPNKLMDYIRNYFHKINVTKLLRACQRFLLWNEAVYLHSNYEEYDNAVKIMIEHSPTAFKHDIFVTNIQKVSNHDLLYKAVTFYLEEEPARLNELLKCITLKVDLSKVVQEVFPILFPQTKMFPRSEIADTSESSPSGYNPSNPKTTKP
jgi:clathrin heavy chain